MHTHYNKILVEEIIPSIEAIKEKRHSYFIFANLLVSCKSTAMKKYFTEKNALTVMVALFSLIMMIKAFFTKASLWEAIAFGLAFSLAVEVICHRAKETK
jgi:uncharacterized membrane protein YagU involved in acid resistance